MLSNEQKNAVNELASQIQVADSRFWKKETMYNGQPRTEKFITSKVISDNIERIKSCLTFLKNTKSFISYQDFCYADPKTGEVISCTADIISINDKNEITMALRESSNKVQVTLGNGNLRELPAQAAIDPSVGF